jgi:predicted phosphodiesterase
MVSSQGNELTELYDILSVLYDSLPAHTDPEWKLALKSVLYGDELLAEKATCYGEQQKKRNHSRRTDYQRRRGNGNRITEFSAIQVREPRPQDTEYLPPGAVVPVAPESESVLPVNVSGDEMDRAISLLAEFPAEPAADEPGSGGDVLLDPDRVRAAGGQPGSGGPPGGTTFLFVSDTHVGYERRAKTDRGDCVSWIGEIASHETFDRIREIAIERDVDAVVHTGDFLDNEVTQGTLDAIELDLDLLSGEGIPVYCIIGSHDHDSHDTRHAGSVDGIAWLKRQRRNGSLTELSTNPTSVPGGSITLYGVPAGNVGIDDVGTNQSRGWGPSDVAFGAASPGLNVLCLHDSVTPYQCESNADVDVDEVLDRSRVAFDCVLVGDEHKPKDDDFENGYTFEADDGTPVFYTGPAIRISKAYRDHNSFVTELTITAAGVTAQRHTI